ncbi:MAG: hypothetical protein ACLGIG_04105 [Actinomycetes bacterium]
MRRSGRSIALATTLALTGLAGGVVLAPALATAATGEQTAAAAVGDRVERLKDVLQGLVDNGTLNEEQRDKVAQHLAENGPPRGFGPGDGRGFGPGGGRGHGPGGPPPGFGPPGRGIGALKVGLDVAADKLGMSTDDLVADLRSGKSLADVAGEKGVSVEDLTAALEAEAVEHIDAAVAEGRLTQAEAEEKKAALDEHLARAVQREGGRGRGHGWGPGGNPNEPDEAEEQEQEQPEGQDEP